MLTRTIPLPVVLSKLERIKLTTEQKIQDDTTTAAAAANKKEDNLAEESKYQLPGETTTTKELQDDDDDNIFDSTLDRCIYKYSDMLLHPWVKSTVVVLFFSFLLVTIRFIYEVKDGLDVDDIAPKGSPLQEFLNDKTTYFSSFDATIVTQEMNYPCKQKELMNFITTLKANPWVSYVEEPWINLYLKYMQKENRTTSNGIVPPTDFYTGLHDWDNDVGASLDVLSAGKSSWVRSGNVYVCVCVYANVVQLCTKY